MTPRLTTLLGDIERCETLDASQRAAGVRSAAWIRTATDEEVADLLSGLLQLPSLTGSAQQPLLATLLAHLQYRFRDVAGSCVSASLPSQLRERIIAIYRKLGEKNGARHHLLCVLSAAGGKEDLAAFTDLVIDHPPGDVTAAALAFVPLFQNEDYDVSILFPRLLDGLAHLSVAVSILDLANFVTRRKIVPTHPATERKNQLASLLGRLVQHLGKIEEQPSERGQSLEELRRKVSESVSLCVSLCDALALIGDSSVVGKLYQASELGHRQLRTEAAAALARLGETAGIDVLLGMAAEPVVRLRVLAHADELNLLERVDKQFTSPVATAEAELVSWLAQSAQFGMPPQQCELVDSRTQYWPGYDEAIACYLFRYTYRFPQGSLSNVGIAGPLAHSFSVDLADLSVEDIYAAFAGWQAEHEQIYELDPDEVPPGQRSVVRALQKRLSRGGFDAIQVTRYGSFFGQLVLVAIATHKGTAGVAVADENQVHWYPGGETRRPIGPVEAYCIYKGRKLLRTFNP